MIAGPIGDSTLCMQISPDKQQTSILSPGLGRNETENRVTRRLAARVISHRPALLIRESRIHSGSASIQSYVGSTSTPGASITPAASRSSTSSRRLARGCSPAPAASARNSRSTVSCAFRLAAATCPSWRVPCPYRRNCPSALRPVKTVAAKPSLLPPGPPTAACSLTRCD